MSGIRDVTPRPWEVDEDASIWAADDLRVARLSGCIAAHENAEHIVRCTNSFDDLVAALEECYRVALHLQDKGTTQQRAVSSIVTIVDIALRKARGEQP